jgi:signal recognition particle subunit SRP54
MIQEIKEIDAAVSPRYKLLVLDSMTGQESLSVAESFDKGLGYHYAILSKMDSDARGGAAFAFRYAQKKPILFVGVGEKIDDLQQFHPDRMAGRILGMGDMLSLIERAEEKVKESEQEALYKAFTSGKMNLHDFASQLDMMGKIGSLSQIAKYMPGMGGAQISQEALTKGEIELKRFRAIISSMTAKERFQPGILDGSRKQRVAKGAGTTVSEVNLLLERFEQSKQYVKLFKKFGRW